MDGLVTLIGGGGFVGRYVAQALMKQGARLRIAERDPRRAWFLKPLGGLGQTQFVAADVTKPETIRRAVAGADAVVNLVGSFDHVMAINARGAAHVAEAAAGAGVKTLVHVSAIGADPHSPAGYGRSKAAGEAAVRQAVPGAIIVRPSTIFGREDQFVNRFAGLIAKLPVVPVMKPDAHFQPVFAGDVGEAVARLVADADAYAGRTFELGGPDVLSMMALNRWIGEAIGRNREFIGVPDALGSLIASAGFLPGAPITRDQWLMLQRDAVVSGEHPGFAELGMTPAPLDAVAPQWLVRFRKQGRFASRAADLA